MGTIKRFLRKDRDYFRANLADIRRQNARVLRIACMVYLLVLALYTAVVLLMQPTRTLAILYAVFDCLHLALCAAVFSGRAKPHSQKKTDTLRAILEITLLSFFLLEAVFAFPGQQSIYFPFPILLLVMVFTYTAKRAAALIFSYVAAFVALVCIFKSPDVRLNDLYIASATLVSALIGYITVSSLRHDTSGAMGRLRYLSMIDGMTGLYNKQTFESLCRAYMEDKTNEKGYALLFIDMDRFKNINDGWGHQAGDAALKGVAQAMRESFYEKDYLCRFGGDEFLAFMVDVDDEANVKLRVRAFQERIAALAVSLKIEALSLSVGVAMKSAQGESYAELVSRADGALYVSKEALKDRENKGKTPAPDAKAENAAQLRTVLVVDDSEVNRSLLRRILSFGYTVLEAENGKEALDMLKERGGEISAVLLDIVMPVMDGYALLKAMRSDESLSRMPVIVTTGKAGEEAEMRALSLGANDFVAKPYRSDTILRRLDNAIRLRQTASATQTER